MKEIILLLFLIPFLHTQAQQKELTFRTIENGKIISNSVDLNFLDSRGNLTLDYVESVNYGRLDSVSFTNNDPDAMVRYIDSSYVLNYNMPIKTYSPEYNCLLVAYYTNKAMQDYNKLFDNKIDFNSQQDYRNITVIGSDFTELTSPKAYIMKEGVDPSIPLFYHEVGHRAFWYLQDSLGVQFKGLSLIHMGLLEYFTMSFSGYPLIGENFLPKNGGLRSGEYLYSYLHTDTLNVNTLLDIIEKTYSEQMKDSQSNYAKFVNAYKKGYGDELLNTITDNHRGGMILASTLWRIMQQLGEDITNKMVVETILNLNAYKDKRSSFMKTTEGLNPSKIEWCDVYYGLLQKDKELNEGVGQEIIKKEFKRTEYPTDNLL